MEFLKSFVEPFGVSLFANYAPAVAKKIIRKINGNNEILKNLFTSSIIKTIESNKSNFVVNSNENIILKLIQELKNDDTKLYIIIKNICENKDKNFLNILEEDDNKDFIKKLFIIYSIDISHVQNSSFYDVVITNLLVNYKQTFFNNLKTDEALILIFQEVLQLDNISESLDDIKSMLEEFKNTKNIKDGNIINGAFKEIKFNNLEKDYSSALACVGLGEKQVSSCPHNSEYIDEIRVNLSLTKKCVIKGESGTGKSLLTYQVAKTYYEDEWNIYKLDKNIFIEHPNIDYQFKKSFILIDDAQTLSVSNFETLADYANDECLILFNWNSSTYVNSNFLYTYKCINIVPIKQVEMLKNFSLNNLNTIQNVLETLNISIKKYDHFSNIESRIERASKQSTPWQFNYVLTEGWRIAKNHMELLENNNRLDVVMAVVAIFQYCTLDNGVSLNIITEEIEKYSTDTKWLKAAEKTIIDYCIEDEELIKHKHYAHAKEVLHLFVESKKDENINVYIIKFFKRILLNEDFEVGQSNILEFIMFDYKYIEFYLKKEKFSESLTKNLFLKSKSSDVIKIRNLNSLIRFDKNVLPIVEINIDIIYKWIIEVNRDTAYNLSDLINTLHNETYQLNITEDIMKIVFNKIIESPLIDKSRYSWLYNRLHMFSDIKGIENSEKLKINISNLKFGIGHYHFAKVISDLSYLDEKWANECIKINLESIGKNFNENLMESYSLYKDILENAFGLIPMMLDIKIDKKSSSQIAKKLAKLIKVNTIIKAFDSLKLQDTQNFSSLLFFFKIYDKTKIDEISNNINYEYLKILYKDDILQEHNHKTIVYGLYSNKSKLYEGYITYLIDNCKCLNKNIFIVNPKKSFNKLKEIKKYNMDIYGSGEYDILISLLNTLDEENKHDISLKIIFDNKKIIQKRILNNISNVDNNKDKYDFLIYLYKNSRELLKEIFSNSEEVSKLIKKIYKLLRGKNFEKKTAKLYIFFIKELTMEHEKEIKELINRFSSIKRFTI